jgi:multidrug efflux pump subunit AcrA (membrane-fusion protein)
VLLIFGFFWWRAHGTAAAPAAQDVIVSVQAAKAERGLITNEIAMIASLVPQTEATISPKVSAQIARMQLLTNRVVNAGDALVRSGRRRFRPVLMTSLAAISAWAIYAMVSHPQPVS